MRDYDNDGKFPDETPVEVRYPRSKREEHGDRCGRCEADASLVPESVTRVTGELGRLRRVHGSLYRISFDPLSGYPWRAKALGTRRKPLESDSPGGLRLRIGDDKRGAARRASRKPS